MATLQELIDQKSEIERAITKARNEGRAQALAKVVVLMTESGLSVDDVAKAVQPQRKVDDKVRKLVAPKYRDPATGNTWTGRGLRPRWLASAMDGGKSLSDFAV